MKIAVICAAVAAIAPAAQAGECEALAARIIAATGAEVALQPDASFIRLKHPDLDLSLSCGRRVSILAFAKDRLPPRTVLALVGGAGAIVANAPASTITAAAAKCQALTLRDDDQPQEIGLPGGARVACNTGAGGGLFVNVSRPSNQP